MLLTQTDSFRVSSSIEVPVNLKDDPEIKKILSGLVRKQKNFNDPNTLDTLYFYEYKFNNGIVKIPRLCKIKNYNLEFDVTDGLDIDIEFKSTLRTDREEDAVEYLCTHTNGILKLNPGEGKTVISIATICRLKKKSIIFVHKDSLVTQWIERFTQHSTISKDDIGILETSEYKNVIQKPIVIGTVQTMNNMIKKYPDLEKDFYNANFGIGIWDECHTTGGAQSFSKSIYYIPAKRCFGLSATPCRSDHNEDIIGLHLGEVVEPTGTSTTLLPRIIMTFFDYKIMKKHNKYIMFGFPDKDGKVQNFPLFDKNRYLTMLTSKKERMYINTIHHIIDILHQKGRKILVICDRIKIIDQLSVGFDKDKIGYFLPRSGKLRDSELHKDIVFSTPGSSRDGTDNPDLDCLVLATPLGNLDQAIGRVCRLKEGKPRPIVIDFVDTGCDEMVKWGKSRTKYYKEKVQNYSWSYEEKFLR